MAGDRLYLGDIGQKIKKMSYFNSSVGDISRVFCLSTLDLSLLVGNDNSSHSSGLYNMITYDTKKGNFRCPY